MALAFMVFFLSCESKDGGGNDGGAVDEVEDVADTDGDSNFNFNFSSQLPDDVPVNATPDQLVEFAWNEFIALNWKSSFETDGKRDNPDTSWEFSDPNDPNPSLLVWETYAHRSEYRPASGTLEDFDNPPHYDFGDQDQFQALDGASFDLWNNLDESNEIGSCFLWGQTDEFGVDNTYLVRYQAKCNSDQYNYVKNTFADAAAVTAAQTTTKDNIGQYKAYYEGATSTCDCPEGVFCLPCNTDGKAGAIEIKTAWRRLAPSEDASRYITRNAIYFVQDAAESDPIQYGNDEFALIGIHIIRKTQNHNNFVIATFEQVDVEASSMGYITSTFAADGGELTGQLVKDYPRYSRLPLPPAEAVSANAAAKSAIIAQNAASKLQYYQLTGVQGTPQTMTVTGASGQDSVVADSNAFCFYLANYVIESDTQLGNFHGSFAAPHSQAINELYDGNLISGGGCQGCHGSAQMGGSDFSFISASSSFNPDYYILNEPAAGTGKLQDFMDKFAAKAE